jgi:tRNA U34 5-methylaminomethyl-2-thiouridine-forming methyltransferase MnmC
LALRIIKTDDGSESLFDDVLNETYHSTRGAQSESLYVFIHHGLDHFARQPFSDSEINVLEIGFGTGLNALLACQWADLNRRRVLYQTLEPWPVDPNLISSMQLFGNAQFRAMHETTWGSFQPVSPYFKLKKSTNGIELFKSDHQMDVIFFDAFAPSRQHEVWTISNLRTCYELLAPGGLLTTYCAQGQFKRNLASVGFNVEILPGALGKKEMVRAVR